MKELEYGKGYKYAHNEVEAIADMSCLPSALEGASTTTPEIAGSKRRSSAGWTDWEEIKKKRRS